jgi:hypothetical protein
LRQRGLALTRLRRVATRRKASAIYKLQTPLTALRTIADISKGQKKELSAPERAQLQGFWVKGNEAKRSFNAKMPLDSAPPKP